MASKKLLEMPDQAIAREMQVPTSTCGSNVQWVGVKGFALQGELKSIAVTEMKHAEAVAEHLFCLGNLLTTKPAEIAIGKHLRK